MPEDERSPQALNLLSGGEIELKGRMPWSSNGTFLVGLCMAAGASVGEVLRGDAIYEPARGERPLWDFPGGLYRREVAAWRLSEALGWAIVPATILRLDAPLGQGSLQTFVDADFSEHYFTLLERDDLHPQLRRIAVFDLLANNADRKSGHCLLTRRPTMTPKDDVETHIWGIDHGVCFHDEPKLRTVIWDFAGERIEPNLLADVAGLLDSPPDFAELLTRHELAAFRGRVEAVLRLGHFPDPLGERPYPWPLV
jgi:uncharacterized repeat protein (TIGR03843 family)